MTERMRSNRHSCGRQSLEFRDVHHSETPAECPGGTREIWPQINPKLRAHLTQQLFTHLKSVFRQTFYRLPPKRTALPPLPQLTIYRSFFIRDIDSLFVGF